MFTNLFSRESGVHVRFGGRSFDITFSSINVDSTSSDREIKRALARHLDVSETKMNDYVIDRHRNGNVTLRPQAVFG
jgi:hypothetical protein